MSKSAIEWTENTWNPVVGCSIVSPGCTNCYAMKMAARIEAMGNQPRYAGTTRKVNGNAIWTGKLAQAPDSVLLAPLKRKKPTTYFVNSMGDLFHEDCPDEWIDRVFAVMALSPQHTFQVLTKRAARMRGYVSMARAHPVGLEALGLTMEAYARDPKSTVGKGCILQGDIAHLQHWPLPNVWLGVSAERQQEADERIPLLLQTPAAIRFISAEPLLGPIDLMEVIPNPIIYNAIHGMERLLDWIIVGGESGPNARPMYPDWARGLRNQCAAAGVAFFFKQWGEWADTEDWPSEMQEHLELINRADGNNVCVGKKRAGRLLDGREHNAMPEGRP